MAPQTRAKALRKDNKEDKTMDYKKVENLSNGEWVLTEIKKEYGNYLGFHRNLPPGTLCPAFRVDVPPFSLA